MTIETLLDTYDRFPVITGLFTQDDIAYGVEIPEICDGFAFWVLKDGRIANCVNKQADDALWWTVEIHMNRFQQEFTKRNRQIA